MVQIIKPHYIERVVTQTAHGEVTINLNLTITLDRDGTPTVVNPQHKLDVIPDSLFAVPEFDSGELLEGFGDDAGG